MQTWIPSVPTVEDLPRLDDLQPDLPGQVHCYVRGPREEVHVFREEHGWTLGAWYDTDTERWVYADDDVLEKRLDTTALLGAQAADQLGGVVEVEVFPPHHGPWRVEPSDFEAGPVHVQPLGEPFLVPEHGVYEVATVGDGAALQLRRAEASSDTPIGASFHIGPPAGEEPRVEVRLGHRVLEEGKDYTVDGQRLVLSERALQQRDP